MSDPINFTAPMIRALLDGRKIMERKMALRDAKPAAKWSFRQGDRWVARTPWRRVKPGDRLWCRETWTPHASGVDYAADIHPAQIKQAGPWRSPIHMPRAASRLTLVVNATKIERVQEITDSDAIAEGIVRITRSLRLHGRMDGYGLFGTDPADASTSPGNAYCKLWKELHGLDSWDANPEVVALTFTVHKTNIDEMKDAQ